MDVLTLRFTLGTHAREYVIIYTNTDSIRFVIRK